MFNVGDIIVCIDDSDNISNFGLTYGKRYTSIKYLGKKDNDWDKKYVHIINDRNESQNYYIQRFVSLSEYRKMKLNKICQKIIKDL